MDRITWRWSNLEPVFPGEDKRETELSRGVGVDAPAGIHRRRDAAAGDGMVCRSGEGALAVVAEDRCRSSGVGVDQGDDRTIHWFPRDAVEYPSVWVDDCRATRG